MSESRLLRSVPGVSYTRGRRLHRFVERFRMRTGLCKTPEYFRFIGHFCRFSGETRNAL